MFDIHREEIDWAGRKLVLETGKIARQADGAVFATYGESAVLATVVSAKEPKPGQPPAAMRLCKVVPTVGGVPIALGHSKCAYASGFIPTRMNRGRSCGTPNSQAFSTCQLAT